MVCEKCWADAALLARSEGTSQTEAYYKILARHNHDSTTCIAELEAALTAAKERGRTLNDDLYYACELAVAYAHSEADQEWAAKRIDELKPPERELPAPPEQEA